METNLKPIYPSCVLGDVNFLEYGGGVLMEPAEGQDTPGLEVIIAPEVATDGEYWHNSPYYDVRRWLVYQVDMRDRFKFMEHSQIVVDREHPDGADQVSTLIPWWGRADEMQSVADSIGSTVARLAVDLCSDDVAQIARGYESVAGHYGWGNFDAYSLYLDVYEAYKRYGEEDDGEVPARITISRLHMPSLANDDISPTYLLMSRDVEKCLEWQELPFDDQEWTRISAVGGERTPAVIAVCQDPDGEVIDSLRRVFFVSLDSLELDSNGMLCTPVANAGPKANGTAGR